MHTFKGYCRNIFQILLRKLGFRTETEAVGLPCGCMCCLLRFCEGCLLPGPRLRWLEAITAGLRVQKHPFHLAMAAIKPEFHTYLQLTERLCSD